MSQAEECAAYAKALEEILNTPDRGPVVGELTGHLRKWQKSILTLLQDDFGRTDSALYDEDRRKAWRIITEKVPATLVALRNLFNNQKIVISSKAALKTLDERITYYSVAIDLLGSTLGRYTIHRYAW